METIESRSSASYARTVGSSRGAAAMHHLRQRNRTQLGIGETLVEVVYHLARVPAPTVGVKDHDGTVVHTTRESGENVRLGQARIRVSRHCAPQHHAQAELTRHAERSLVVLPVGRPKEKRRMRIARAQQVYG